MSSIYKLQIGQSTHQPIMNNMSETIFDRQISDSDYKDMYNTYDSIVYHMEKKYLCDQHVESFIDIVSV